MGIGAGVSIENTGVVNAVDTHFSMGVNDMIVFHDDAHMGDFSFGIIEKRQVSGIAFFDKTERFPLLGLLGSIAGKPMPGHFIDHLGKSAAIDSKGRFSAP